MSRIFLGIAFLLTVGTLRSLHADLPWGPPEDYEVWSSSGQHVARITVTPPRVIVYGLRDGVEVQEWSMEGFHRKVYLADDGHHLVIGYADLVLRPEYSSKESPDVAAKNARDTIHAWGPANYSPDMVMLQFLERGRIVREVTLHELMPDLSKMIRTASSWHWGDFWPGLNDRGEFVVNTVDYRTLYFDVESGQLLKTESRYVEWLGDVLRFPRGFRAVAASCVLGVLIGVVFGGRFLSVVMTNIAVCTAILLFPVWAETRRYPVSFWEAIANNDFLVAKIGIFYLLLSTLSAIVASLLWRRCRRSWTKS